MPFTAPATIRLALPEEDGPDMWVDIKNPRRLTFDEEAELYNWQQKHNDDGAGLSRVVCTTLVKAWNLTEEDDSPAPIPSTDPGVYGRIPGGWSNIVMAAFNRAKSVRDPNAPAPADKATTSDGS